MGRHGCACCAAVFAVENVEHVGGFDFVTTDIGQSTDNGPDHVAEEAVGSDDEAEVSIADILPDGLSQIADVGAGVGVKFGEGGKIAATDKQAGGNVHGVEIERRGREP